MSTGSYNEFGEKMNPHPQSSVTDKKTKREKSSGKKAIFSKKAKAASTASCPNTTKQFARKKDEVNTTMHCSEHSNTSMHPDHGVNLVRLRRVQGQLVGLEKMITDRRYCVDILVQFRAVASALKAIEGEIFEKHLRSCVQSAMSSKNKSEVDAKIDELMKLVIKR